MQWLRRLLGVARELAEPVRGAEQGKPEFMPAKPMAPVESPLAALQAAAPTPIALSEAGEQQAVDMGDPGAPDRERRAEVRCAESPGQDAPVVDAAKSEAAEATAPAMGAAERALTILRNTTLGELVAASGSNRLKNRAVGAKPFELSVNDFQPDADTERLFLALPAFGPTTWNELVMRAGAYRRQVLAGGDPLGLLQSIAIAPSSASADYASIPDITLSALIRTAGASTRLTNCTHRSDLFELHTVDDLLSGRLTEAEILQVPELGRNSLRELLGLAEEHATGRWQLPAEPAAVEQPLQRSTPPVLEGRTVADLADHADLPVRIANRLGGEPRLAEMPLADIWADPDEAHRRLRKLDGLGRRSIAELILLVQRIGGSLPAEDGGPAGLEPGAGRDEPDLSPPLVTVRVEPFDLVQDAVGALSAKHRFVLEGRYGLSGEPPRTLEEMGRIAGVTRERVRQVEKKALGVLAKRPWRDAFEAWLAVQRGQIWETLADGADLVPLAETAARAAKLAPWLLLAVDVVHGDVRGWLQAEAVQSRAGWLAPGLSARDLDAAVSALEAWLASALLPRPLADACGGTGLRPEAVEVAVPLLHEIRLHHGYLHRGHVGAKARRISRLHRMAINAADGAIVDVWRLVELDEAADHEDDRSPRMVLTQLGETPHLFHHLVDHWWLVLPAVDDRQVTGCLPDTSDATFPRHAEPGTLAAWLQDTLHKSGPMRHVDLRDGVRDKFPELSAASVGPTLLGSPIYLRVAPGAWDIRGARRLGTGPALLSLRHARAYARAARSGQGRGLYPAWTAEFEHAICVWARDGAEDDVFRSLLAVVDPTGWPVPEQEQLEWRRLKRLYGVWSMPAERRRRLGDDPPTADEVLSSLVLTQRLGGMGWTLAGRLAHAASGAQSSADLLAILAAAGAVRAPEDWQLHHPASEVVGDLLVGMAASKYATGRLDWTDDVMVALLDRARHGAANVPWAAPEEVHGLLDAIAAGGAPSPHVPRSVVRALEGAEDLFGSDEWDRLFSALD
jgi:hypothetical protein